MITSDYNTCVDDHADGLYRFILKNIKDEEEARDIVQDAFEKMWRNVENVEGKKAKSYLFTTAYHTMIDRIRRKKQKAELFIFLDNNPDLRQEFNLFSNIPAKPDFNVGFISKDRLKKNTITFFNYKTWFTGYHENDLSAEQKKEVEFFINKNQSL